MDYYGYIYVYFRGNVDGNGEVQQVHMAESRDGLYWYDMNENKPVLVSDKGTRGARDPFIFRAHDGSKYYILATDLDASDGKWKKHSRHGSKDLIVWESTDLVNWTDQRMVRVSNDDMGCTWAPEVTYDEERGVYVVYWSAHMEKLNDTKVVFYAETKDFYEFTEPKVFVGGHGNDSVIDTTMIRGADGKFYRFTKNEDTTLNVYMEVSDSPVGEFRRVHSNVPEIYGVEGPEIFRLNDKKTYCLMLDGYAFRNTGKGFFPLLSTDLSSGKFRRLKKGEYKMPTGAKHGMVMAVTKEEYDRVIDKWGTQRKIS